MRTVIAWEPDNMAEVVRIVADVGSNGVEAGVPDVMTGLPTNTSGSETGPLDAPPLPGDSAGGGGGSGGYPGFMGEYLVRELGSWYAVEGTQVNALEDAGGACTSDRAAFDWAEFSCRAARFRFEFAMRVEPLPFLGRPEPVPEAGPLPDQPEGSHTLAMAATSIDGARLLSSPGRLLLSRYPGHCRRIPRWQGADRGDCYFPAGAASWYSPLMSKATLPSGRNVPLQVPFPLMPFSLPVPPVNFQVQSLLTGAPSFRVVVPLK